MSIFQGRFAGRAAIITGGASGLGLSVAKRMALEGATVAIWDVNAEALDAAAEEIGVVHTAMIDVADPDAVERTMRACVTTLGKLDILVCSAGITGATVPVQDFPIESWKHVLDINMNGLFYCCRAAIPFLLENGYGRIVNVASVAGKEGNPNASAYSASKAAVIGFTKSLGKELATANVMVNALTPATFESPILAQLPQSQVDYMRSKIPMSRLGAVEESAAMVCFMASEECSFTTASTFDTSGGRTTF